ncbi:hypothetical protein ABK040_005449 [Willaertia magna]
MNLSLWQLIIHDLSKFSPSEWFGYLLKTKTTKEEKDTKEIEEYTFLYHQNRNPHHFEYWLYFDKTLGQVKPLKMPMKYVTEMIVDWVAANKSYSNSNDYLDQRRQLEFLKGHKTVIHSETRKDIYKEIVRLTKIFKFELNKKFKEYLEGEFLDNNYQIIY